MMFETERARRLRRAALAALAAIGLASCDDGRPDLLTYILETPAPPGSGEPFVAAGPDGFYLTWLEPTGDASHALRFARWDGDRWTTPRTVVERQDLFVNWADFPSLMVLEDGTLAAHWLERSGPGTYHYDVRMAISRDAGESWSEDIVPHRDSVQAEHGFVSLFPAHDSVGVLWLDGRATVEGHPMTLRSTTVSADGSLGEDVLVDASTCDCCQTDVALAGGTPVAVYRGRTEAEVRDIRVARRVDGRWTTPTPVHEDGWVISACPVNGPAIDAYGSRVAVAWFTAAPPLERTTAGSDDAADEPARYPRVLAAFSDDGGRSFGEPIRVDDGGAMGRVDLEIFTDGTAMVTWMERTADGAAVRFRSVTPDGRRGGTTSLGTTAGGRASGFPRMAGQGNRIVLAFTEAASDTALSRVRARFAVFGHKELAP